MWALRRSAEGGRGRGRGAGGRIRAIERNESAIGVREPWGEEDVDRRHWSGEYAHEAPVPSDWEQWPSPCKGSEVLVQALEREGVASLFAYPGGASMEIHQAITKSNRLRNVLCRHEQGEVFAAEGYAKSTGNVGCCIATSGPGATNIVTGLADALMDSVPLVAITGQVPRKLIGTDAFQETPIVEISRQITKHNYLVMQPDDIPRIVREAFFLARSGRPGPVLIDIPKDVQQARITPTWDFSFNIAGYMSRLPPPPKDEQLHTVMERIARSERPIIYAGGGCLDASEELNKFAQLIGAPVTQTLMGLGSYPMDAENSLHMLGMHGTVTANTAIDRSDLLLAFGVRFDDRVTGKLEAFAANASIVHVDIDPAEISKNKEAHIPVNSDVKPALARLNTLIKQYGMHNEVDFSRWRAELDEYKAQYPLTYEDADDFIIPQWAIEVLREETNGDAIVSTGVGQHQMWAAQWYGFRQPRSWITSGGLGAMGVGLPFAMGAAAANPSTPVVDIDGDGSFVMNIQELATCKVHNLPVKVLVLNNQYLGMVVQWEDRFYQANHAHTYLGSPEQEWEDTGSEEDVYPDFVACALSFGVPSKRVQKREELRDSIREMLETEGPYVLDVMVPHVEHVLPMVPSGGTVQDTILDGDGRTLGDGARKNAEHNKNGNCDGKPS